MHDHSFIFIRKKASVWLVQAGGAIHLGYESFSTSSACHVAEQPLQPTVGITQSVLNSNIATDRGGAIGLQSGVLSLQVGASSPINVDFVLVI